jgi:hypothetical protein
MTTDDLSADGFAAYTLSLLRFFVRQFDNFSLVFGIGQLTSHDGKFLGVSLQHFGFGGADVFCLHPDPKALPRIGQYHFRNLERRIMSKDKLSSAVLTSETSQVSPKDEVSPQPSRKIRRRSFLKGLGR